MTDSQLTIGLIGSGAMGEAIVAGLLRDGVAEPERILASGPRDARGAELERQYHIRTFVENAAAARPADVVILAVKPQKLQRVLANLKGQVRSSALVLSIVAGASIQTLQDGLGHPTVVRAMPNTPAQIGQGITVWTASPSASPEQVELARLILCALGQEVFVEEEIYLDMATAVSGTGPAYVFLFMEAWIDAGVHLGFPRRIAEQLVTETIKGTVDYYKSRKVHPAALRNEVTSPGGTSAAALYYLDKAGFRTAISRAIWAAYERSQELGKGKGEGQAPEKD